MADILTMPAGLAIKATRNRASVSKALSNLLTIQRHLQRDIENPATEPHHRASCARAWTDCEERIRILRGKPLPGAYKPLPLDKKRKPDAVVMGD